MEDKRQDLKSEKQRRFLEDMVARMAEEHPSFYYLPTVEIAAKLEQRIRAGDSMSVTEQELMRGLSTRDIQILLAVRGA
ncbi:MAG: hypothetical protein AAGA68_19425 [Pseudomonadota bacterium]